MLETKHKKNQNISQRRRESSGPAKKYMIQKRLSVNKTNLYSTWIEVKML